MAIGTNYATPVTVNGFQCKNCTDVDYAKKNIDPAHPKSGPFGINAKSDPSQTNNPAVTYAGALKAASEGQASPTATQGYRAGDQISLSV